MKKALWIAMIIAITLCLMAAVIGIFSLPTIVLNILGIGAIISSIIIFAGIGFYVCRIAGNKIGESQANRETAEANRDMVKMEVRAAKYRDYLDGFGMLHLLNLETDIIENLSAFPGSHHNGTWIEPHPAAAAAWHALVGKRASGSPVELLPQLPPPQLDFFAAMSDPLQAYAIIGPQRIGKSLLAQRLAQHLTNLDRVCLVIGTKAEPGEWQNCKRFIGNDNVPTALSDVLQELARRLSANSKLPPLAVFLDDWINSTVLDSDLCERFFVEASTRFLTAGIVPYFLLQSDSKVDWGTKHGAALKNNFVHLALSAPRINGHLDHSQLKAVIVYPGDKEQHQVRLPEGRPMLAEPVIIQPSEDDQEIISLAASGLSYKEVTEAVYGPGKYGKFYNDRIDRVLAKYGLKIAPRIS